MFQQQIVIESLWPYIAERPLMNGTTNHRVLPEKNFQKLFKPVQAKREEEVLDLSSEEEEETGEDETPDTFDGILDDHWERVRLMKSRNNLPLEITHIGGKNYF